MIVKNDFLDLEFPENMVRKYRFKGYDLKDELILQHLEVVNDALNEYCEVLWKEKNKLEEKPDSPEFKNIKSKISALLDIQESIVLSLQEENKKKQPFIVKTSAGEEVVVNYSSSWENIGLVPKRTTKLEKILIVFFPRLYAQLNSKRNNYYHSKIKKYDTYIKYKRESNVKDKKILAYKFLNEISPLWQANETLELVALNNDIEIVKARDFENSLFNDRRKNLASN